MRKLAIKIKLDNSVTALANMKAGGKPFGEEYHQFDRVFLPRNYDQAYQKVSDAPHLIIRTTTIKGKESHMMILKRMVGDEVTYFYQTQIMDYNQTAHIVNNMGYELYVEVPKIRRKAVSGSVIFYLDNVDGYGWYLKVEKNLQDHESENTDELWNLLIAIELQHAEKAGRYSQIIGEKRK